MTAARVATAHEQFQDGAITALELANVCLLYTLADNDDSFAPYRPMILTLQELLGKVITQWMQG